MTDDSPSPPARISGCSVFLWAVLLGIAYLSLSPEKPTRYHCLVNAAEQTYIEAELQAPQAGQPCRAVAIYYTHLGGWLSWKERRLWDTMPTTIKAAENEAASKVYPITFKRQVGADSVVRITVSCRPCRGMTFVQPKRFPIRR